MEPRSSRSQKAVCRFYQTLNILELTTDALRTIEWLRTKGMLERLICPKCNHDLSLISNEGNVCDDYIARCSSCIFEKSLRTDIILSRFRISLDELTRIIFYHFIQRHNQARISKDTGINKNTVSSVCKLIRNSIHIYMQYLYKCERFGTKSVVERDSNNNLMVSPACEIDESLITHRKLPDGTRQQVWCVGIFDRSIKEYKIFVVVNRSAKILMPLIKEHIYTDPANPTRIYSDGWAAYLGLPKHHYSHHRINHSEGFGFSTETTNKIESFWSELKRESSCNSGIKANSLKQLQIKLDTALWFLMNKNSDLVEELAQVFDMVKMLGVEGVDDIEDDFDEDLVEEGGEEEAKEKNDASNDSEDLKNDCMEIE